MRITRRPSYRPLFNIAPTDQYIIITAEFERRKSTSHAGVWSTAARDNSRASQCIDARVETLEQRPSGKKPRAR
jgi:putative SOS response-associated peptidase YedK